MGGSAGLKIGWRTELHLSGLKLNGDNLIDIRLLDCQGPDFDDTGIRADPQMVYFLRLRPLIGHRSVWVAARSRSKCCQEARSTL